ncbi:MAG: hypothetical protein HYS27_18835 [Deltaproteobacteria bacterium]|nr:hypothetical protein [Deltaproteobacteria bacterium]
MAKEGRDSRSSKDGVHVVGGTHSRVELATMLSNSVGQERALEAVAAVCAARALGEILTTDEALAVLEELAQQQGVIGIAARFAKGRALLTWQQAKTP